MVTSPLTRLLGKLAKLLGSSAFPVSQGMSDQTAVITNAGCTPVPKQVRNRCLRLLSGISRTIKHVMRSAHSALNYRHLPLVLGPLDQ